MALSQTEASHFDPYRRVLSHVILKNVTLKSLADGRRPLTHSLTRGDALVVKHRLTEEVRAADALALRVELCRFKERT